MTIPPLSSETLHASCVAIGGQAVLLSGRSGSGKSDLALRLVDRGARLVSDDYTLVVRREGRLLATAPANIAGKLEVRGVGLLEFEAAGDVPVCLFADLDGRIERLPERLAPTLVAGLELPTIAIAALEPSAPVKLELALQTFGLAAT
jgi:hypothetical protein